MAGNEKQYLRVIVIYSVWISAVSICEFGPSPVLMPAKNDGGRFRGTDLAERAVDDSIVTTHGVANVMRERHSCPKQKSHNTG